MNFSSYSPNNYFDEYFIQDDVQSAANLLVNTINNLEKGDLKKAGSKRSFYKKYGNNV